MEKALNNMLPTVLQAVKGEFFLFQLITDTTGSNVIFHQSYCCCCELELVKEKYYVCVEERTLSPS